VNRNELTTTSTRAGSLLLTGYATPLDCLPIQDREKILQNWSNSRIPLLRDVYRSITTLVFGFWVRTSPTLGHVLGFPRVPTHGAPARDGFAFRFVQLPLSLSPEPEVIETDVVIVGSGCGGAVAAKELAEAGLKVLVVDKSYYWNPMRLPMSELEGMEHLFENAAALMSDDATMTVVAGSAWGGGGTVNWSASLQTQGYVRREWAQKFGMPHFMSAAYQRDLDAVCDRMGVGKSSIEHNKGNQTLLEGARKLGWSVKVVPQNTGGEAHNCGYCTLGCGSCGKKGPTETFLPDAAKAGAEFMEGFECTEVVFDKPAAGDHVAIGVRGKWIARDSTGNPALGPGARRDVFIKAKRVIVSAGTLSSPLVLLRSGLKNKHIGRHLHLHPVAFVGAVWDKEIRPWEGPILTSVVNEFENLDGEGYGAKLEATTMLPSLWLPAAPWQSGLQSKENAAKMKRSTGWISLSRDRYGGRIYPDPKDGRIRVAYSPSKFDKHHILLGVLRLAEMAYVEGAREIFTTIPGIEPFVRLSSSPESNITVTNIAEPSVNDESFQAWLSKIKSTGFPSPTMRFASAHQMGTCRMGTSASNSVIDPSGRVWGTQGLYVCDASAFPSASGVNPMITNMAISRGTARGIANDMGLSNGGRPRL
jgi:choline dehydrogenase-like flavoprotein